MSGPPVDKGLSILEWTGKLVPQGLLVSGVKEGWRLAWKTMVRELAPQTRDGAYSRPKYSFDGRIGDAQFPVDSGRYHVYVGNACPWCHRILLGLALRGLAVRHVSITQLGSDPTKARRGGWIFEAKERDPLFGASDLWEVYDRCSPGFRGRCTAPLLVDKLKKRIVSNESSDILRMLNDLHLPGCTDVDLYPAALRPDIDRWNDKIYVSVNNAVYRSGFSTSQSAYDAVQAELFGTLDELEQVLGQTRFLTGDRLTEADVRLLPTLVRFDAVYANLFKCTRRRLADYPNLSAWLRDMWQISITVEGEVGGNGGGAHSRMQVPDTINIDAARTSYFSSLFPLNPGGIVPAGPYERDLKLDVPHGRGATSALQDVTHQRVQVVQPVA